MLYKFLTHYTFYYLKMSSSTSSLAVIPFHSTRNNSFVDAPVLIEAQFQENKSITDLSIQAEQNKHDV